MNYVEIFDILMINFGYRTLTVYYLKIEKDDDFRCGMGLWGGFNLLF